MQASFEDVHALFLIFGWLCWASIGDQVPGQGCNIRSVVLVVTSGIPSA